MKSSTFSLTLFSILATLIIASSCKKNKPEPEPAKSNVNLNSGLILYFPFSGNIADSSGNNNSVQATGGTILTNDEHGNASSAFDASQGRLIVSNNGTIKFDTAFTLCFNFKLNQLAYNGYLSMVDNVTGHGPTFLLGTNLQGTNAFSFSVQGQTALCDNFGNFTSSNNDTSQFIPQAGTWYNMICIYHRGDIQIYMNGNLISTHAYPGTSALLCPTSKFVIGGWWDSDPLTMNGTIDEIRMYDRVLNSDEINQLYKNFQ
jgi:hypothetical protein